MKKVIIAAALVLLSLSPAFAAPHRDITFHDTLRPNGHQRSLAVANATANSCFASTGTSREYNPTQAFKDCMETHGFRWMSTRDVGNTPSTARTVARQSYTASDDEGDWSTQSETSTVAPQLDDEESAIAASNAGYAQDAADAAANVAAAATFDAQMTVGN
jgi:hypothetical protein